MKKLFCVVLFLLVLTGCSNQVSEHSKAIEKLFTAEETTSSSTTDSSTTTPSSSKSSGSTTTPSSSRSSATTTLTPSQREAMTRALRERGIISQSTTLPDALLRQLYNAQGFATLDPELWQTALAKHDFKNLEEQIKPQLEDAEDDQTEYNYKVNVWLPNLAKIDPEELSLKLDPINYDKLHSESSYLTTYSQSIDQQVEKSLIQQLKSEKSVPLKKFTVNVTVRDEDDEIEAEFSGEGLAPIQQTLTTDNSTFITNSKKTEPYQQVKLVNNLMTNLKKNIPVALAPKIASIKQKKNGEYQVKVKLVEGLSDTLKKLKDSTNEEYKKNNPNGLMGTIYDSAILSKLNQKLASENLNYTTEKEFVVKPVGDAMTLPQTGTHEANTETKKQVDQTVTEIKTYVQENVIKSPEERPASSVLVGTNSGTPIAIQTASGATNDYYIKFNNLDNTDTILSAYIRGGEQLTVNLPPGSYNLRFSRGQGDKWYGAVNGFGPSASSSQARNAITVASGGSYTLRLYSVTGGNLPIDRVNSGSF